MVSGEMEIKKIEDSTLRQMAYSKRRKAIFKKAHELSVLCEAEVSIIMCSSNKKLHEYSSPNSSMKKIIDEYQRTQRIDIWSNLFEEKLRRLKDINNTIRRDIMQRMGEELNDLNMVQLCSLEDNMLESLKEIRNRKFHVISIQTDVYRKKVRKLESMQELLQDDLAMKNEYLHGVVENEGDDYKSTVAFANAMSSLSNVQQHRRRINTLVDKGSFEHENSCVGSIVTMEVKNSPLSGI